MPEEFLEIRGARVHNLKNISLRLPHNQLVVVTGVSGSGKSSLVFDLIFAEGRRRYVESLSSYARQFVERMERPDVDEILGIGPTVAIRQKNTTRNPRSTVSTVTEIQDFLRLLYARVGTLYCVHCDSPVDVDGVDSVTAEMLAQEPGSRWYILFPIHEKDLDIRTYTSDSRYSEYPSRLKARFAQLRERGFSRIYQEGRIVTFSTPESLLDLDMSRPIYILVDRIAISADIRERLADGVEISYKECREVVFQPARRSDPPLRFSTRFECARCGQAYARPEPRMFSFNTPLGACRKCEGHGKTTVYSYDRVASHPHLTLREGAISAWRGAYRRYHKRLIKAAPSMDIPLDVPYRLLSRHHRKLVEEGWAEFDGIRGFLKNLERDRWKPGVAASLSRWREVVECPECEGSRLCAEARHVRIDGEPLHRLQARSLRDALDFFQKLQIDGTKAAIAGRLLLEVGNRLRFLNDVGLEYLTLDRPAASLSGGEAQRIQLATSLGARLVGVCYVLDEPSIGLHSRDTDRLIGVMKELRDLGNSVFVVEHDRQIMRAADHLVDLGPAAGALGGEVLFSGDPQGIGAANGSLTAGYLAGRDQIEVPSNRRKFREARTLIFQGATKHNLKDISFKIPLGLLTVVTGVSGSGKSTLMHEVVYRSIDEASRGDVANPWLFNQFSNARVDGTEWVRRVIRIDQALTEQTSRSVPATYIGAFDEIRRLFASTTRALARRMSVSSFSFNVDGGRCSACRGSGKQTVDMQFLADVELPCEDCGGKRYSPQTLEVSYRGRSISDVLELTVDEAIDLFRDNEVIVRKLSVLSDIGLGYIRMGQPSTQLSGGEAQRMKLAQHIAESKLRDTLFLFDEPTTGLHFDDIRKLLGAFNRLILHGSTVLVVEHNLDVVKCADWVIDLGPDGGDRGGHVVAQGPPEQIAASTRSHTGRYLREMLT